MEPRIRRLEALVGVPNDGEEASIFSQISDLNTEWLSTRNSIAVVSEFVGQKALVTEEDLEARLEELVTDEELDSRVEQLVTQEDLDSRLKHFENEIKLLKRVVDASKSAGQGALVTEGDFLSRLEYFDMEIRLLKKAVGSSHATAPVSASRFKVPEPKLFGGVRSAKELENFLWDMETYFAAAKIPEEERVSITSMYLEGDAKLWWRARLSDDTSANRAKIDSWESIKGELKEQFLPRNSSWRAREALRNLKHAASTRDYVRDFTSLMLDVKDMSEEDKLFNFLSGLQPWAQTELRRQDVKNLPSVVAAADRLVDFKAIGGANPDAKKHTQRDKGKAKSSEKEAAKSEGSYSKKETKGSFVFKDRANQGCFICEGDHRMKDCPKRARVAALLAEEDEEPSEEVPARVNPIQLLSALHAEKSVPGLGLMFVKVYINGREVMALVDSGATHNFVADQEIQKLGLVMSPHKGRLKAVNSEATPNKGMAKADLQVGSWQGQVEFMVVPLDDYGSHFRT
ncbi:uncharacterized protein LOC124939344 [Impatiens glandulifera]|uniref:uncharacterized protein LOC124939344 n=1 Tax=Impatiens glandulifera TaxID=253017 RepID=UPI001FB199AF|nr:uncharacterized protein LOC124939344 [Impatiens glandulifera]